MEQDSTKQEESPLTLRQREVVLAREIFESGETFGFNGIEPVAYSIIKADEEEYPGLATPIDERIERCRREGIKVVLGKNPKSGNVYILPAQSDDIGNDSIRPRHLQISEATSEKLRELILLDKS